MISFDHAKNIAGNIQSFKGEEDLGVANCAKDLFPITKKEHVSLTCSHTPVSFAMQIINESTVDIPS